MKKRLMSLLLVLVMVLSLLPTFALNAAAEEGERVQVSQKTSDTQDGDLHMTKTLYRNSDGTYDIDIESWATGEVESQVVNQAVPTDFVLILDQSGSMYEQDIPTGYTAAGNQQWHPNDFLSVTVNNSGSRNNSISVDTHTYYYNVPGTDEYYEVYYKDRPASAFTQIPTNEGILDYTTYENFLAGQIGGHCYEYGANDSRYSGHPEPIYYLDSDGTYYRVYTYSEGLALRYHCTLFYYDSTGARHNLGTYTYTTGSVLNNTVTGTFYTNDPYSRERVYNSNWDLIGHWEYSQNNYTAHGYKPYYKDANGVEHQLPGSLSVDGEGDVFYNGVLYEKNENVTRVSALETAVSNFVDLVNTQAVSNNVNHKVAVVGFSSPSTTYNNTELLSTGTLSRESRSNGENRYFPYGYNYNGPQHNGNSTEGSAGGISVDNYQAALQDASTAEGVAVLKDAAHAVTAYGGTEPEYGFYMAENILKNRTDKTYTDVNGQTQKRNTVVVFFTDGHPGDYDYSDQIAAANTVVKAAKRLKTSAEFNYTKVYSVGMFASGDDQPLTFAVTNEINNRDNYLYQSGGYYYLRGNTVATTNHNDTIKDYMECVSSKYPNATNFLNHTGTGDTGTSSNDRGAENQDQMTYYMRVTDAGGLERAFASIASTIETSETSATVDASAVLRDTVYTGDFDVSGASVTAESVKVHMVDGQVVETSAAGDARPTVTQSLTTNGRLSVTGFDYSALYTSDNKPGEKLVVTIHNVEPKKGGHLWSNSGDAGVYPDANSSDAVVAVASPDENIARITKVIDFNAPMIISDGMQRWKAVGDIRNGTYNVDDGNFTYQLSSDDQADMDAVINVPYISADSALVYGNKVVKPNTHTFVDGAGWTQVTTVPASSVYYSDKLDTAVTVGDGSGYNAGLADQVGTAASQSAQNVSGTFYFTFYGTGIDVYCTTHANGGYVSAAVFSGSGAEACVKANRVGSAKTIREYSAGNYYNTPAVFFTGLPAGTYTLKLVANDNAQFKLDGVRVYNPVEAGSAAETELNKTDEANATYLNLRKVLLNDNDGKDVFTVTNAIPENGEIDPEAVSGVLFINDVANVVTESNIDEHGNISETPVQLYQSQFEVYKANGPKNEIYLDGNQAITFQLNTSKFDANTKVYIGLSAPVSGSGDVVINGVAVDPAVTTVMDMYYPIDIDLEHAVNNSLSVTIKNTGSGIISVTNLKITGVADLIPAAAQNNEQDALNATRALFMPVTMKTVRMAANNGVDPEAVVEEPETPVVPEDPDTPDTPDQPDDPTPGWNDNSITAILQNLFRNLFQSLRGLFGGLGNW